MKYERLFSYDHWASREVLKSELPDSAVRLLAHIIGAQWIWLSRLSGTPQKMAVWPELTRTHCAGELDLLRDAWTQTLGTASLQSSIRYANSRGEQWTSVVEDVLTHVILHGAYHRGQIAAVVRGAGEEPPYTDYIQCTRIGAI